MTLYIKSSYMPVISITDVNIRECFTTLMVPDMSVLASGKVIRDSDMFYGDVQ